jgi:hypothetical protein
MTGHKAKSAARIGMAGLLAAGLGSAWLSLSGCSLVQTTVDLPFRAVKAVLPGGGETEPVDPIDLQEDMLRFADNFVVSTSKPAEFLQRDGQAIKRDELLTIKVILATDVYGLATGSNALANLVGLTVFASVARWRVQDYWLPKVYGVSAEPMLKALEVREGEIWKIANRVLKSEMLTELREAIQRWRKNSSKPAGELEAFASNSLVNEVTKGSRKAESALPSSVFALLDLDPLAELDPATRELTETRLFAERALFMGQRLPQLIEWQMELLALRTTSTPQVTELISGASQIGSASDRISRTLEQIPGMVSTESQKWMDTFKGEQKGLGDLSRNFGQSFMEGSKMATSTAQMLKSFDDILTHVENWPKDPKAPPSPPFEIKEYAATALEISRMSVRLTETLRAFQATVDPANLARLSAQAEALTRQTQQQGEALIDYAFRRILELFGLCTAIVLTAMLLYRWMTSRIRGQSTRSS